MNSNPVVLIEIGGSHSECLLSQMHAIQQRNRDIILICTKDLSARNPEFGRYVSKIHIIELTGSKKKKTSEIKNIWNIIKESGTKKVIFNTAHGNHVRRLCLYALFSKIKFFGIIHTTLKFKGSFSQKIVSLKIKRYLLLSDHLLSTITPPNGVMVDYFYPIRYPSFSKIIKKSTALVTIIGGVENQRRDLLKFAEMVIATKEIDVSFVFLGRTIKSDEDVISFRKKLEDHNLSNRIISFDNYIPQEDFDAYLRNTDLILPLVHPNTPSANQYFKNQISGAMSISFGYKVPLLIHEEYAHITEMKVASFYYNEENFASVLKNSLGEKNIKADEMSAYAPYDVVYQENRFANFIFANNTH